MLLYQATRPGKGEWGRVWSAAVLWRCAALAPPLECGGALSLRRFGFSRGQGRRETRAAERQSTAALQRRSQSGAARSLLAQEEVERPAAADVRPRRAQVT